MPLFSEAEAVTTGLQGDQGVQGHVQGGNALDVFTHEVAIETTEVGLVSDDDDFPAESLLLEHEHHAVQPVDHVLVTLALGVAVVQLIFRPGLFDLGVVLSQLSVGDAVANAGVDLVQGL